MRAINKLSDAKVKSIKQAGMYGDGAGLWLQVVDSKVDKGRVTKSWCLRFMLRGQARQMGLGPVHTLSLADARDVACEARKKVLAGKDPIKLRDDERDAARAAAARRWTFEQATAEFIKDRKDDWKNEKHAAQVESTLRAYAFPVFGKKDVAEIDAAIVEQALEKIWKTKRETARRVRQRIEAVFSFAKAKKRRSGDNPAAWAGDLKESLRSNVVKAQHHPALPFQQMAEFMADLRWRPAVSARMLEFLVLVGCRTTEALLATWDEFDLERGRWTLSPERTKQEREHVVVLPARAIELIKAQPRIEGCEFVFSGATGAPLSGEAMSRLLDRMNEGREAKGQARYVDPKQDNRDAVVHGFRSSFADWGAEETEYPNEMFEIALGHQVDDKTQRAYRRGVMIGRRLQMMEDWSAYCGSSTVSRPSNVLPMRASA